MPLRIAAIPDVTLDVVIDDSVQQTFPEKKSKTLTIVNAMQEDLTTKHANATSINTPRRNPVYGLEEMAMDNYSHIDNPAVGPQPRAPQYTPSVQQKPLSNPTGNQTGNLTTIGTRQAQSPQYHNAGATPRAIVQLTACAIQDDKYAQLCLGDKYRDGDGIEQDYQAAYHWYLKASVDGDALALNSLGDLCRLGLGVPVDHTSAFRCYSRAVEQELAAAECNLGQMYDYGLSVQADHMKAMEWYRKAADQGDALAQSCVGDMYSVGKVGVPRNDATAMEWYLRAADQDLAKAQFKIGILYENGQGVESDKSVSLD